MHRDWYQTLVASEAEYDYIEEIGTGILVVDDGIGKSTTITYPEYVVKSSILQSRPSTMDVKKFLSLLDLLEDSLFLTVQGIFLINSQEDWETLYDELEYDYIDFDEEIGRYLGLDDYVVINLNGIHNYLVEELFNEHRYITDLNTHFWLTLIHELRHSYQKNPLFEAEFWDMSEEGLEDDAEIYARRVFETIIEPKDYRILTETRSEVVLYDTDAM